MCSIPENIDFSMYMNPPTCPVNIGEIYYRTDLLFCDTEYKVIDIIEKTGKSGITKYYAVCEYLDSFTDKIETEEVYAYLLSKEKC